MANAEVAEAGGTVNGGRERQTLKKWFDIRQYSSRESCL